MFSFTRRRTFRIRMRRRGRIIRPLRLEMLERRDQPAGLFSTFAFSEFNDAFMTPAASQAFQGLTPSLVRNAYGFDNWAGDGSGQTIAIVSAYDHPTIEYDLQVFSRRFGLPEANFTKIVEPGTPYHAGWASETALDVQWAHAAAPGANILLVEARSSGLHDLLDAVDFARHQPGVSVVSMSWGTQEFHGQEKFDRIFTTPSGHQGVTFVASTGDFGAAGGVTWPASSRNVLAVGGTQLTIDASGNYRAESAWAYGGGGVSRIVSQPKYDATVTVSSVRSIPDVSYAADPGSGFLIFNSASPTGSSGWFRVGGTSAGTPQWAGIIAVANQGRELIGKTSLAGAQTQIVKLPASDFHDVVTGSNGFAAQPGADLATGRGSPIVDRVVASLVSSDDVQADPGGFVGPLPDMSKMPQTEVKPGDNVIALILAAIQESPPVMLFAPPPAQPKPFDFNALDSRLNLPTPPPIIMPTMVPLGTVDLSARGGGGGEEQPVVEPPKTAPNPPAEAKPAVEGKEGAPRKDADPEGPAAISAISNVATTGEESTDAAFAAPANQNRKSSSRSLMMLISSGCLLLGAATVIGGCIFRPDLMHRIVRRPRWLLDQ